MTRKSEVLVGRKEFGKKCATFCHFFFQYPFWQQKGRADSAAATGASSCLLVNCLMHRDGFALCKTLGQPSNGVAGAGARGFNLVPDIVSQAGRKPEEVLRSEAMVLCLSVIFALFPHTHPQC